MDYPSFLWKGDESALTREALRVLLDMPGSVDDDVDFTSPCHLTTSTILLGGAGHELSMMVLDKGDMLLQPGGHVEDDDTNLRDAARREVIEEVGARIDELSGPLSWNIHTVSEAGMSLSHFDVRFFGYTQELSEPHGDEAPRASWRPVGDITDPYLTALLQLPQVAEEIRRRT